MHHCAQFVFLCLFCSAVLGTEPRVWCLLSKGSAPNLYPQPAECWIFEPSVEPEFSSAGFHPALALSLSKAFLVLTSAGVTMPSPGHLVLGYIRNGFSSWGPCSVPHASLFHSKCSRQRHHQQLDLGTSSSPAHQSVSCLPSVLAH